MVSGGEITGVGFNVGLGLEGNPASFPNVVAGAVLDEVENNIGAISTFSGYSSLTDSTTRVDWITLHPEVAGQANITSYGARPGSGIGSVLTTNAVT